MKLKAISTGILALSAAPLVMAGATLPLGLNVPLPFVEGGLLAVAVGGLVVGVRIVRAKQNGKR